MNFDFTVPEIKRTRVIVNTDAKNEADDQFAIVHALLTPKFDIRGIVPAHFGEGKSKRSMEESYEEVEKILDLMGMSGEITVKKGAARAIADEKTPEDSDGARLIIEEALKDEPNPLFVIFLGPLTDMASALLLEPRIASRLTVIWIGGGPYPTGDDEYNLSNDIDAANVVFKSQVPLWQATRTIFSSVRVSFAELQYKVKPCGKIGEYLFQQTIDLNNVQTRRRLGESWALGDSPTIALLLDQHPLLYDSIPAPVFTKDMYYMHNQPNRAIRVYREVDVRFLLEDMFCKIAINYPPESK